MTCAHRLLGALLGTVCLAAGAARGQFVSVVNSPHDLSATGGSEVRAAVEDEICIFCHAPHNASPVGALWNRSLAPQAYTVYSSRALDAKPGQPTGTSKLCLSCHDGTIALGAVLSRDTPIRMSGGVNTMPAGAGNLGTDLRDDHPISFRFDAALAAKDSRLKHPSMLRQQVRLDSGAELQCTTCHDAHNNAFGKFLVMRNTNSELCVTCHQMGRSDISGHAQCTDCHQSHTAPSGPFLLRRRTTTQTCLACHDGSNSSAQNIASDVRKPYRHDNDAGVDVAPDDHTAMNCSSCHEPHTMERGAGASPPQTTGPRRTAFGRLGNVAGTGTTGSRTTTALAEQEVCYKCHGDGNAIQPKLTRRTQQVNMRQQFSPSAISFHAIGTTGRASYVPSLRPGWSNASSMVCSDCHASDSGASAGVHGSMNEGLLVARLSVTDYTSESASAYDLCYRCHDRNNLLSDVSFSEHKRHVVDQRVPCVACHDSHGIASNNGSFSGNTHLMNFATNMVFPDQVTGRLEYRNLGFKSGQCFLSCHGQNHSGTVYPAGTSTGVLGTPAPKRR